MGSRFVALERGERNIHWIRLAGFTALVFATVPTITELAWYRLTGTWSSEVLIVAGFFSTLIAIRSMLRAFSIPECELKPSVTEPNPDAGGLPQPEGVDSQEKEPIVLPC